MTNNTELTNNLISLELLQLVINHSDDSYILRVALTQKLKDLLGCRLVLFASFNPYSDIEEIYNLESSDYNLDLDELKKELQAFEGEITSYDGCRQVHDFRKESPVFKGYDSTIVMPIRHKDQLLGCILLFDMSKIYDTEIVLTALNSSVAYISIVMYNAMSYHHMDYIIRNRTSKLSKALKAVNDSSHSKSLFLANMSHEMRTPLNGILGFVELLLADEPSSKEKDYLGKIQRASHSLLHMITEVLDFSRLEFESIDLYERPFNLMQAVEDIIGLHQAKAHEKNIDLLIQSDGFPRRQVIGDVERFHQILNNLVSNAIKFTERGSVSVNIESHVEPYVLDGEFIEDRVKLMCDVVDSGVGIREENLDKIFEVFTQEDVTTTRKFGGSGLGLSIAKKLIQLMNGDIKVESTVGQGSVFSFYIYFSLAESLEESSQQVRESKSKYHVSFKSFDEMKILVVEDNDLNANLIGEILKMKGIRPDYAANGKEAIDKVADREYDLIFMDCQMPIMDGYHAASHIRETVLNPVKPYIIALTAAVSEEDRNRCYVSGMNDYLSKPINVHGILSRIEKIAKKP
jgi:signal transduction histidine kinase/ActR/RegA family two-component response regulator